MVAIEITFTRGKYHATPWDRHVNEGAVEWPPSPWRLLRCLIALWKRKFPDIEEAMIRSLVAKLSALPVYNLPKVQKGHTRHYMPKYKSAIDGKKDLIFDTFHVIDKEQGTLIAWPDVTLEGGEKQSLTRLLNGLGYLGRAESWARAAIVEEWTGEANCTPHSGPSTDSDSPRTRLLAPLLESEYRPWRERQKEQALNEKLAEKTCKAQRSGKTKKPPSLSGSDLAKIDNLFPTDVFNCLQVETVDLHKEGWSRPPGARWMAYLLPPEENVRPMTRRKREIDRPTTARFALTGDTVQGEVRPLITGGLYLAETTRQALMALSRDEESLPSPCFSGKEVSGTPLTGHRHAFTLPCDDDNDGRLDHLIVYSRDGFGEREVLALTRLRRLWQHKSMPDLFPVLVGLGSLKELVENSGTPKPHCLISSNCWESCTPFMLTRHPKRNGKESPEEQLKRELANQGFPAPTKMEGMAGGVKTGRRLIRWSEFARVRRQGQSRPAVNYGYGFRLFFEKPVQGPIVLGYGAHFGLGLFKKGET